MLLDTQRATPQDIAPKSGKTAWEFAMESMAIPAERQHCFNILNQYRETTLGAVRPPIPLNIYCA